MTPAMLAEARGWLLDCYPDDADVIEALGAAALVRAVDRRYPDGWRGFLADAGELVEVMP